MHYELTDHEWAALPARARKASPYQHSPLLVEHAIVGGASCLYRKFISPAGHKSSSVYS
jgi:hypothetical protein